MERTDFTSCWTKILACTSHKRYCHPNKGYCANEHVQKDNRKISIGDSVSSALIYGKAKNIFLVTDPGKWGRKKYSGIS